MTERLAELGWHERSEDRVRLALLSTVARKALADTALVQERDFAEKDVQALRRFFVFAAPLADPKLSSNYWDHILLSSIYHRLVAEKVDSGNFNPFEAEAIGLSRYIDGLINVNDVDGWSLCKNLGVRQSLHRKVYPLAGISGITNPTGDMEDLAATQSINDITDNLARQLGLDVHQVRVQVWGRYEEQSNQNWLLSVKNAQENLDPRIDLELDRPPISKVVWDWGGVLFSGDDDLLLATVASEIGCEPQKIGDFLASTPDGGRTGKDANGFPITEEDYMRDLWQYLNLPFPGLEKAREIWDTPAIQPPVESMREIVAMLAQNPNIEQWILSDGIPGSAFKINKRNARFYPELDPEKTLVSSVIGRAKGDSQASAFGELLQRLGQPDSRTILFIDDREIYTNTARTQYNIRAMTFRGDQHKTPSERIRGQLTLYGLIS